MWTAIPLLLACLAPANLDPAPQHAPGPAVAASVAAPISWTADPQQEDYEQRRAEAKGDAAALWRLVDWCEANGLTKERRSCLREILDLDDGDRKAHELLGHVFHDGKWYTSQKKLDQELAKEAAKAAKEAEKLAKEQGLVRWEDGWVKPEDLPFLKQGLVKDDAGRWIDPEEVQRLADGWTRQDLAWVSPEEKAKVDQGLWKCGDDWLSAEQADAYHARVETWWQIPGAYFHLYTTLPRQQALEVLKEIDATYGDLVRIYGRQLAGPVHVVVLNSLEQYQAFAKEGPGGDSRGLSSMHGAYFADAWLDGESMRYMGAGVAYANASDEVALRRGKLFARHAAAHSFVEVIDPSTEVLEGFADGDGFDMADFWEQKRVPQWFRYAAASYVERHYIQLIAGREPDEMRKWSVSNILRGGALDPISEIIELKLEADSAERQMNEIGLVMAFILDGKCAPVSKAHGALKAKLSEGGDCEKEFTALQKALTENEEAFRAFAGV